MNYRDDNKEQLSEKINSETCKITVADLLGGKIQE
jgi:hypothetical protein